MYDWYDTAFLFITVTPFVDKIEETKREALSVLSEIKKKTIKQDELDEVGHLSKAMDNTFLGINTNDQDIENCSQ